MMEGLKEALQYITGLKAESMEPKLLEINGETYCTKDLTRYHRFPMASNLSVNTLTALVDYIKGKPEELRESSILHVVSPTKVLLFSGLIDERNRRDESDVTWSPEHVNFYTDTDIWELDRDGGTWYATRNTHDFGEPLMVALIWDATNDKPFGQSRLKEPIRRLIQGYVRTVANATIGLEFATSPQKYLLGVSDEQYDALIDNKFKQYVGSILYSTNNPETGEKPNFGQLSQGNIEPHVQMLRMLATQYSAATGLAVTDVGVVNDANPTSSEAIIAQSQTLILMAEQLNRSNGDALHRIAKMALAIELGTTPDDLPEESEDIIAHFKNPAMPSIASTTDAALKIATARQGFADTDIFLEMIGFDQADIRRIRAQEQRAKGDSILTEEFVNADNGEGMAGIHNEDVTD